MGASEGGTSRLVRQGGKGTAAFGETGGGLAGKGTHKSAGEPACLTGEQEKQMAQFCNRLSRRTRTTSIDAPTTSRPVRSHLVYPKTFVCYCVAAQIGTINEYNHRNLFCWQHVPPEIHPAVRNKRRKKRQPPRHMPHKRTRTRVITRVLHSLE